MPYHELVVIGCSWGGLAALERVLGALRADFALPIVVNQHRGAQARDAALVEALAARTPLPVRGIDDKDPIEPGTVHVSPPDYHVLVEPGRLALSVDEPVLYARPSIDVLFESAADAYASRLIGVVLTGANADGAAGLARVRRYGGVGLVQDPATAERRAMPEAAISAGGAQSVRSLDGIAEALNGLAGRAAPEGSRAARARPDGPRREATTP